MRVNDAEARVGDGQGLLAFWRGVRRRLRQRRPTPPEEAAGAAADLEVDAAQSAELVTPAEVAGPELEDEALLPADAVADQP
eukprot:3324096-Alexandrium_andersonii.AAC.1